MGPTMSASTAPVRDPAHTHPQHNAQIHHATHTSCTQHTPSTQRTHRPYVATSSGSRAHCPRARDTSLRTGGSLRQGHGDTIQVARHTWRREKRCCVRGGQGTKISPSAARGRSWARSARSCDSELTLPATSISNSPVSILLKS